MTDITVRYLIEMINWLVENERKSSVCAIIDCSYDNLYEESNWIKLNSVIRYAIDNDLIYNHSRNRETSYWMMNDDFLLTELGKYYLKSKNQVTIE